MSDVAAWRRDKDEFFRRSPESPLEAARRSAFRGLAYFPIDPAYRFALELDATEAGGVEDVETSDGSKREMARAGRFSFRVGDAVVSLVAYDLGNGELFVPFRDATSGSETYGAGRYLEAELRADGRWDLDFNRAYSPFCAYSDSYQCPLPPRENWLAVPIRAGEMAFPH